MEFAKQARHDGHPTAVPSWTPRAVLDLLELPFNDLLHQAHLVHRENFDPNMVQLSTLLSIKTGGCPEDCAYCPQSRRFDTGVEDKPLLGKEEVVAAARVAKAKGASRFCMGAAWRGPKEHDLAAVLPLISAVHELGLETCATLGLLRDGQAERLKEAGLDYYNHNLDTAREFYGQIITTRDYQDRLETLERVRLAGLRVCCGGIVGLGEDRRQRATLIAQLASLAPQPESVPINTLVQVDGTPLYGKEALDPFELVRVIAVARISMPRSHIRLSAGRENLGDGVQALCFFAGANSFFYGEKLLTTNNPGIEADQILMSKLGITPEARPHSLAGISR